MKIFDGHNDTLVHLFLPERGKGRSFFEESAVGQLDLPRARKGGLAGGMFSIFTPPPPHSPEADGMAGFAFTETGYRQRLASPIDPQYARTFTDAVIDFLDRLEAQSDGAFQVVRDAAALEANLQTGVVSAVLHIEGAEAIREDFSNLPAYYDRGLRALGLVWSRPNAFGCGVPFEFPASPDTGPGLTQAGQGLVEACNRLGILIDLAHITEKGFWDVARLSNAPLVVTHADVHALCPSTRNLTDAQIDAVGKSGGVIGVNFEPYNTSLEAAQAGQMAMDQWMQQTMDAPLRQIVRHIAYIARRAGVDSVAFGSDFDGADMPTALKDAAGLPGLVAALDEDGFSDAEIEKIAYQNWLRVFRDTWKPAPG
jgi:membrane dipeptidase